VCVYVDLHISCFSIDSNGAMQDMDTVYPSTPPHSSVTASPYSSFPNRPMSPFVSGSMSTAYGGGISSSMGGANAPGTAGRAGMPGKRKRARKTGPEAKQFFKKLQELPLFKNPGMLRTHVYLIVQTANTRI